MAYQTVTVHHKKYPFTSIMAGPYNGDPTGTIDCAAAIETFKADNSNVGTLHIPKGTFLIGTNLTIPAGVRLYFEAGASFSISTGIILTINGTIISAERQTIFSGAGTVVSSSVDLYSSWFSTFAMALGSTGSGNTLHVSTGTYNITADATIPIGSTVELQRGAILTIATTKTLTINGYIKAGPYQIFAWAGSGKVVFGADSPIENIYPEWWGVTGDGTTDDTTAMQACFTCPVNSTKFLNVKFQPSVYKIDSGVTISEGYCSVDFNGAQLDASGMGAGTAITVNAGLAYSFRTRTSQIENLFLLGPSATDPAITGIYFNDSTNDIAQLNVRNVKIYAFKTGMNFGNHTFLISLFGCTIGRTTNPISVSGTVTAGENITWYGGDIYESVGAILINGVGVGQLQMFGASIDYTELIATISLGQLILNDCYIESSHVDWPWPSTPITLAAASTKFVMRGGTLLCPTSPKDGAIAYIIDNASTERVGVILDGVYLANTETTSNELVTGAGVTVTKNLDFATGATWGPANDFLHATQGNRLVDGGFEEASVIDAMVTTDSAAITDRTNGTNIDLTTDAAQQHVGAKALKVVKAGAAATAAGFTILAPIDDKTARWASRIWYAKPGAETGTMTIATSYAQVEYFNQYGIPQIGKTLAIGSGLSKVFAAGAVAWTEFTETLTVFRPPAWATHMIIVVTLTACDAGTYWFDDAYIGGY